MSPRMGTIRTFVCLPIPESARDQLVATQQRLRQSGAQVSWVKPDNIHLTIKFLGSVQTDRLEKIIQGVRRAAGRGSPIQLELTELGCFPNTRAPKIIWAGPKRLPEALGILYHRVEEELVAKGFAPESRPFSPHFTLGRVRSGRNVRKLAAAIAAERLQPLSFALREIVVMGSELHPSGSLYTPIARISWASRTQASERN